jgi:hypothetical protein
MKICLRSTNEDFTQLALDTYLSNVKNILIDNNFVPNSETIVFSDKVFLMHKNPIIKTMSHIAKYGDFFGRRSPLILNNSDGIYLFRAIGIIPHNYTSKYPNFQEMSTNFIQDEEQKNLLSLYFIQRIQEILHYDSIDNYSKYKKEYYELKYLMNEINKKSNTYINLFGLEINQTSDLELLKKTFKAYIH